MFRIEVSPNALIDDLLKGAFLRAEECSRAIADRKTGEVLFFVRPVSQSSPNGESRKVCGERAWQLSDTVDVLGKQGLSTTRGSYQIASSPQLLCQG